MQQKIQEIVVRLYEQKYPHAKALFWAGSTITGHYTNGSDLDIMILLEKLPQAYRETFRFEEWKIDSFVHDLSTLEYFFEKVDKQSGIPALPEMVAKGVLITPANMFSDKAKQLAIRVLEAGPPVWDKPQIDKARFFITDLLEDVVYSRNRTEQIASLSKLYELLGVVWKNLQKCSF